MPYSVIRSFCLLVLIVLAACQSNEPLPTLINLENVQATDDAEATLNAPTATATSLAATLPPTFTPTLVPSETPTDPALLPTNTPFGFNPDGTIFYIYNNDSIAALRGDGSQNEIIVTFGVGQPISDLTLSPDGELLAYVAPGSGTAREVYVSNLDGTYTQQISCLDFGEVLSPTWSPDGQSLVFFAAPQAGAARNIYIANFAGSDSCPTGNQQRIFLAVDSIEGNGLAWNPAADKLFFSIGPVYVFDLLTERSYQWTLPSGFSPDYSIVHHPTENRLDYLHFSRDFQTGEEGGSLSTILDTSRLPEEATTEFLVDYDANGLRWDNSGRQLMIMLDDGILLLNPGSQSSVDVVSGTGIPPVGAFSPDDEMVAYTDVDENGATQIYRVKRNGSETMQLSQHPEGIATDLVWVADKP